MPVTFAVADNRIYTAVDHKPKNSRALRRLVDIRENAAVSLLVDHYEDDWNLLWWVRADGEARVVESQPAMAVGLDLLVARYPQYQIQRPEGPLIEVTISAWRGWAATPRDP